MNSDEIPAPHSRYQQLAEILRERLQQQPDGGKLPSVRALMKRFKVSQHTVMSALRLLEQDQLIARRLGSGIYRSSQHRQPSIAYCRPDNTSPQLGALEHALRTGCEERNWRLLPHRFPPERIEIFADEIQADGYVIQPEMLTYHSPLLNRLIANRNPCVILGRNTGSVNLDFVTGDDGLILNEFIKGLVARGHRRLAFLVSEPHFYEVDERIKLFTQLCSLLDLEYFEVLDADIQYGPNAREQSAQFLGRFLENLDGRPLPFTGLITCSTPGSISSLRALHDAGYQAPRDYSLCCLGMDENASYSIPSITNANPIFFELAHACLNIIDKRLHAPAAPSQPDLLFEKVAFQPAWRESAGPAPR